MIRNGPVRTIGGTKFGFLSGANYLCERNNSLWDGNPRVCFIWRRFLLAPLSYPAKVLCLHFFSILRFTVANIGIPLQFMIRFSGKSFQQHP